MSQSYFCPSCGGKNLFELNKPKFCSLCGTSFGPTNFSSVVAAAQGFVASITTTPTPVPRVAVAPKIHVVDQDDEDAPQGDFSGMSGLDVIIEKDNARRGSTLDDIAFGGDPSEHESAARLTANTPRVTRKRGRKKIMKELPQSFTSEARLSGRAASNSVPDLGDGE